jgi:hypothetical protein
MAELKQTFALRDEDRNLNLGPLGNLLYLVSGGTHGSLNQHSSAHGTLVR